MDRRTFLTAAGALAAAPLLGGRAMAEPTYTTRELRIASFDGAELACTLYLPEGDGTHHVVLSTHGWGGDRGSVASNAALAAQNGYVALTWDQRGFGESDGEVGLSGPKEVADTSALIDWLAEHPRVRTPGGEPRVGMVGASYGGGIQLNVAAVDDRVAATVPIVPWHDLTYSLAPNGVPKAGWVSLLYGSGITGARGLTSGNEQPEREDVERGVSPRLHEIYAKTLAANELPPEGASFLKVRSPVAKLARVDAPALVVQGWPDTLFVPNEGQRIVDGLRATGTEARLVLFDGGHTLTETAEPPEQVAYLEELVLTWFEAHLRGKRGLARKIPPATYWDVQRERFETASSFPPADTTTTTLPLSDVAGKGTTPLANSVAPTSTSQLAPENEDVAAGATAANFDFAVEAPTEVIGTPTLRLSVEPLGARAFVFAKLSRVSDGAATLINNQTTPVAVEGAPGEVTEVTFDLVALQRHFAAGDALRLTLATTDAGFTGARQSLGVRIHHTEAAPSVLTVGTRAE